MHKIQLCGVAGRGVDRTGPRRLRGQIHLLNEKRWPFNLRVSRLRRKAPQGFLPRGASRGQRGCSITEPDFWEIRQSNWRRESAATDQLMAGEGRKYSAGWRRGGAPASNNNDTQPVFHQPTEVLRGGADRRH